MSTREVIINILDMANEKELNVILTFVRHYVLFKGREQRRL